MAEEHILLQFHGGTNGPAPLGGRTRPAAVQGVGDMYQGEIVDLLLKGIRTSEKPYGIQTFWSVQRPDGPIVELSSEEFRSVDRLCQYVRLDGSLCLNSPVPGSVYCEPHLDEQQVATHTESKPIESDSETSRSIPKRQKDRKKTE